MKKNRIIYWTATALMCLVFLFSAGMYLFATERAAEFFVNLGFPTWLVYPLAVLKILAVVAILTKKSKFLKELAYAGFLYDAVLALAAHLIANDGEFMPALIAVSATLVSWVYDRKFPNKLKI